jgi:D-alanine transaminase
VVLSSLLAAVMMRREAEHEGAMEAIMLRDGIVTEGAATNCFVVKGEDLATPPPGHFVLPGITREVLPVTCLDGAPVGPGVPGPLWHRVDGLYQNFKAQVRQGHV